MRRALTALALLSLSFALGATHSKADDFDRTNGADNQVLVRVSLEDAQSVADSYGLIIVASHVGASGESFLMVGPPTQSGADLATLLMADAAVHSAESAQVATLPEGGDSLALPVEADILQDLARPDLYSTPLQDQFLPSSAWSGYSNQHAVQQIRLTQAHHLPFEFQATTIAFIDTGVDPDHVLLSDALVPGYDFLLSQPSIASEWDTLDPSLSIALEIYLRSQSAASQTAILSGMAQAAPVNPSSFLILDQSLQVILEGDPLPPAFGHGTMVAGLLRLVAPNAKLMPIKAFNAQGQAHIFDIVRAIHFAVDQGADVINMSFSTPNPSAELENAIAYAQSQGVICLAAAGNTGERMLAYPAAFSGVLGVAAVDGVDLLSPFSNYGTGVAVLAAPGAGIISTYPGSHFAAGWGTSFSTALASGTAGLIQGINDTRLALKNGAVSVPWLDGMVESGLLDVPNAVIEAHTTGANSP